MTTTRAVHLEPMLLVVTGGDPAVPAPLPEALPEGSVVIAADSGLDRLHAAGWRADHVVGDLDSVDPGALEAAVGSGSEVHRHPTDKDATDLELALELGVRLAGIHDIGHLHLVGAGGGRLDHLLGDVFALASPRLAHLAVTARLGPAAMSIVRRERIGRVEGAVGDVVSLLPVNGIARGVRTTGLRWSLVDADLVPGTTRALSNELVAPTAEVTVEGGVVAIVRPGTTAAPVPPRGTPYDPTPRAEEIDRDR